MRYIRIKILSSRRSLKHLWMMILLSLAHNVFAHQPVYDDNQKSYSMNDPYIISDPEVSKAFYAELLSSPNYYKIESDRPFKFYVGITQPKLELCDYSQTFSFEILDSDYNVVDSRNGADFDWMPWYEKFGKQWYWVGPEIGKEFLSDRIYNEGTYFIKVFNEFNEGKYVLAVGDDEQFGPVAITKAIFSVPKINKRFWEENEDCN